VSISLSDGLFNLFAFQNLKYRKAASFVQHEFHELALIILTRNQISPNQNCVNAFIKLKLMEISVIRGNLLHLKYLTDLCN
jgi:hypothetical protein